MPSEIINKDVKDIAQSPEINGYKEIKPEGAADHQTVKTFWDNVFSTKESVETDTSTETVESGNLKEKLEQMLNKYFEDLKEKSEYPETIPDCPFESSDLEKLSPEEVAIRREEFDDCKVDLKKQWEEEHGTTWPTYEQDVYSSNGNLIRKAGSDYDAHHIKPLGMGGKNEVENITPLHAEVHYDKQGVHSPDSPYTKMDKMLGGADL